MIAVDVSRVLPTENFGEGVDRVVRALRSVQPAAGFDSVVTPGIPELITEAERTRTGIPFFESTWKRISELAASLNVDLTSYVPTMSGDHARR